jgi:hypothetical protein
MNMETIEVAATAAEDKEPIYYAPKRLTLVSDIASILSWVVLVGFLIEVIYYIYSLITQTKGMAFSALVQNQNFPPYLFTEILVPLLTGLVFFAVLQAAATGLNVLLEMDFNAREARNKN